MTAAVRQGNELLVRVEDPTDEWQLRGKQVLEPKGIWYTRVSGIWQTVWMEQVPSAYIEDLHIGTDAAAGTIKLAADIDGPVDGHTLRVAVKDGEDTVSSLEGPAAGLQIVVENAKLWTPETPQLYTLDIDLMDKDGKSVDHVPPMRAYEA